MQRVGRHQCKRSDERDDMTTQGEESDLTARGKALTKGGHSGAVGGYLRLVFIPQQIISCIVVELALRYELEGITQRAWNNRFEREVDVRAAAWVNPNHCKNSQHHI